jgi:hypothetical protein
MPILIVPENVASRNSPGNDVVDGTWRIYSGLSWHAVNFAWINFDVSMKI